MTVQLAHGRIYFVILGGGFFVACGTPVKVTTQKLENLLHTRSRILVITVRLVTTDSHLTQPGNVTRPSESNTAGLLDALHPGQGYRGLEICGSVAVLGDDADRFWGHKMFSVNIVACGGGRCSDFKRVLARQTLH